MDYIFTLKYRLPNDGRNPNELVELLAAEGCEDALVDIGQLGRIALEFVREAESAKVAILGALADIKSAIPHAKLIEVSPDFVGLTDAADIVGMTRQNMRKLMVNYSMNFPSPIHEGSAAVWHLADILVWMKSKGTYQLDSSLLEIAETAMQINLVKKECKLTLAVQQEIQLLCA